MTILLSPNFYLPMKSGVTVFTQQLAETLVRKGHQVVIVTLDRWASGAITVEI